MKLGPFDNLKSFIFESLKKIVHLRFYRMESNENSEYILRKSTTIEI